MLLQQNSLSPAFSVSVSAMAEKAPALAVRAQIE
jgi:hypothetical protein